MDTEQKFLKLKSLIPTSFLNESPSFPSLPSGKSSKKFLFKLKDTNALAGKPLVKAPGGKTVAGTVRGGKIAATKAAGGKTAVSKAAGGKSLDDKPIEGEKPIEGDKPMEGDKPIEGDKKDNFMFNIKQENDQIVQKKSKNFNHLIQKLETKKRKREALKKENPQKFLEQKENYEFKKAELKLNSVKIKDDSKLLKKSLHRIQKKKKKSEKEWKKRIKIQENLKDKRQKKRLENLQKRKRPGFK